MGQGISSLRLRKAIVIRAYNLRSGDETLEEQFKSFAFPSGDDGRLHISLLDIKACLCFAEISWADEMIKRLIGDNVRQDVLFSEFIEFLETGSCPIALRGSQSEASLGGVTTTESLTRSSSAAEPLSASSSSSSSKKKKPQKDFAGKVAPAAPGRARSKDLPPQPPGMSRVEKALALAQAIDLQQSELQQPDDAPSSLVLHPSALCRGTPSSSSVWRKRELVRQERTVQYTTIDANGTLQELVEKETSETEVLHMESRETGEFAHRETTVYEQRETFNDEVVGEQHGVEEYVHLKSVDDEFEYMESTMPKKQGAEGGGGGEGGGDGYPPQVSPRVHDGHESEAGAHPNLDLDDEALAFLQYQELQQQYEQEMARREAEGQGVQYEEGFQGDDLPRSWWNNAAAGTGEDFDQHPSHEHPSHGQHLDVGVPLQLDDEFLSDAQGPEPELALEVEVPEVARAFEDID